MPWMNWDGFQEAHYRPHLVVADLRGLDETHHGEAGVFILLRLAEALGVSGSYAVKRDDNSIHAVFERDVDAARFAATVRARTVAKSAEWASQSAFRMDRTARIKIAKALQKRRFKIATAR